MSNVREKVDILLIYAEDTYGRISEESLQDELEKLVDKMRKVRRSRQLKELQIKISEAEKKQDKEKLIELLQEQQKLL